MKTALNIFWFRRDLRMQDNTGFYRSLKSGLPVLPIFIFDRNILDRLKNKNDARVEFIYEALKSMQNILIEYKSTLEVFYGNPASVFSDLIGEYAVKKVFTNEDYEPYATTRDGEIESLLKEYGITFTSYKDQVIFSKLDLVKDDQSPYTVFTPYSKKWKILLNENTALFLKSYPSEKYFKNLFQQPAKPLPGLASMGFQASGIKFPSSLPDPDLIRKYAAQRDFPGLDATSRLGIHLRFGTISIRRLVSDALKLDPIFLDELIWRDFYHMILWFFPKLGRGFSFKPAYEKIKWRNDEKEFALWCAGKTGYPLVDAGMRQLNQTNFMHNRVRMVTASFLAKHLLVDWRWGEAYFAEKLLDYDLASNNGGWQWAAGTGCDGGGPTACGRVGPPRAGGNGCPERAGCGVGGNHG
jgi:deoxyribodipyrimidine photo-lyase